MIGFTPVQVRIMRAIVAQPGMMYKSMFRLAIDLEIHYGYARACIRTLEARGYVTTTATGNRLTVSMTKAGEGEGDSRNSSSFVPRSQKEELMDLQDLRSSLDDQKPAAYPRPDLEPGEMEKYSRVARKVNSIPDQMMRLIYVAAMISENVRLTKEVNEHRAARGLELLPTYDPENAKRK